MVDPRFISETDTLGDLDDRPNLMELTPQQFESLIQNLFDKIGLDTKQTRPSRDGGVDCVAYNTDPILGGKVVIQAKRYKNTVGVSAVRNLYGTLQNEGASKGILVTTANTAQHPTTSPRANRSSCSMAQTSYISSKPMRASKLESSRQMTGKIQYPIRASQGLDERAELLTAEDGTRSAPSASE